MSEKSKTWYFLRDRRKNGPHSLPHMVEMCRAGLIVSDDLVWTKGMKEWSPAGKTVLFETLRKEQNETDKTGSEKVWYYMRDNRKLGPFSERAMIESIRDRVILPDDTVWQEGMQSRTSAADIPRFADALRDARKSLDNELWYCRKGDDIAGPFSILQLRERFAAGELTMDTPVFSKKLGRWEHIRNVTRLKSVVHAAPDTARARKREKAWYYHKGGKTIGPVTAEHLTESVRKGHLTRSDLVYNAAGKSWIRIADVAELRLKGDDPGGPRQ